DGASRLPWRSGRNRVGADAGPQPGGRLSLSSQIRLLRDGGCRGGTQRAERAHRILPASAPGLFQCPGREPGAGAGGGAGATRDVERQYGDRAQCLMGWWMWALEPHRGGGRGCRGGARDGAGGAVAGGGGGGGGGVRGGGPRREGRGGGRGGPVPSPEGGPPPMPTLPFTPAPAGRASIPPSIVWEWRAPLWK